MRKYMDVAFFSIRPKSQDVLPHAVDHKRRMLFRPKLNAALRRFDDIEKRCDKNACDGGCDEDNFVQYSVACTRCRGECTPARRKRLRNSTRRCVAISRTRCDLGDVE